MGRLDEGGDARMPADMTALHRSPDPPASGGVRRLLAACSVVVALILAAPSGLQAGGCPDRKDYEPNLPVPDGNIGVYKEQLKAYHDKSTRGATTTDYMADFQRVIDKALDYVTERAAAVEKPAVVLDIDETSISNWTNIEVNDFGFIKGGNCALKEKKACGFDAWIMQAKAPVLAPTLKFYNEVRARKIAVFFITARPNSQRTATIRNLTRAGFKDWTALITRSDDDHGTSAKFKSGQRAEIEDRRGYKIIANIGDQESDLKDGDAPVHSECRFKLPNPFYFIK